VIPEAKLEELARRASELDALMCDPEVISKPRELRDLNQERTRLEPVLIAFGQWKDIGRQIAEDREALDDPELGELAREELPELEAELSKLESAIQILLLPTDPNDERNTLLEIRAGAGGEEAALFAADLFRMYTRYAETAGWKVEIMSSSEAAAGGYKEIIALVQGKRVFSRLKLEAGVHRVQRVPATEAQGRVHTSTATVAVLPEADDVEVELDDKDLRFDIAHAGGPGGQSVNTANSAVQITHIPSGLVVKCQDERSLLKNKTKGLKVLKSRLLELESRKQADAIRDERRDMVGGADRSEKIRTYNYPQNRITDHRVGLTLYKLDRIVGGELQEMFDAISSWYQAERLKE
jgi:peptide chain release factor 1